MALNTGVSPEQLLAVEASQLKAAKDAELMKPIRVKFAPDGPDRTIEPSTKYSKTSTVEGVSAQQTILELRQQIAKLEKVQIEDINLLCGGSNRAFADEQLIGECNVDWMGFGLEDWPPRFISRPRVRGWEIVVDIPGGRDTSTWENSRMQTYGDKQIIFDVGDNTTVKQLKELIAGKINIPAKRQTLEAHVRDSVQNPGQYIALDEDSKTLLYYKLRERCVAIKFRKSLFDANGDFVFDDAFWDEEGYHMQPAGCWIPADSLGDRTRSDASKVDPNQPLSIISDRRQKEITDKEGADGNK